MYCRNCPHAKALYCHVYCKADPELRNLPLSVGHVLNPPLIQHEPPKWCPLLAAAPDTAVGGHP